MIKKIVFILVFPILHKRVVLDCLVFVGTLDCL